MATLIITAEGTDAQGNKVSASVDVEVTAAAAAGPRAASGRAVMADAPAKGTVQVSGLGNEHGHQVIPRAAPGPPVTQASRSRTYTRFTGGYR